MADDARMPPTVARPTLAPALATVTDRPVGHWIAELRSPAFRGRWEIETYYGPRILWRVETDFGRKTTARRSALLTITDPAEALEALIARGVLPPSFAGDALRWFWCDRCNGKGSGEWRNDVAIRCAAGAEKRGCGGRHWPNPRTILDLLAWTSLGADAITRAEQLARETAARLRPWGVRPPVETATTPDGREVECEKPWRVVWRIGDPTKVCGDTVPPSGWPLDVGSREDRINETWQRAFHGFRTILQRFGHTGHAWGIGIAAGYCAVWSDPRPNPYAPLGDLHALGLVLHAIDGDALVLVCPPLGGSNG